MAYPVPAGTELVAHLGAGTTFDVALVRVAAGASSGVDGAAPGTVVVCKRLTSRLVREAAGQAAFARELGLLVRACHSSLPRWLGHGEDEGGPYLLEDRAAGVSLRQGGRTLAARFGRVPAATVERVARKAFAALAEVHELADDGGPLAVVHGDITPDHVFFTQGDAVQFVDFGAARFRGMPEDLRGQDRGTLPFVAPEVARAETEPGAPHDVYALAASLLAFATGERLCHATTDAAMLLEIGERGVRLELIDQAPDMSAPLRQALRRALTFDPARRIASAREVADRLIEPSPRAP